jgi:hypothetical protein
MNKKNGIVLAVFLGITTIILVFTVNYMYEKNFCDQWSDSLVGKHASVFTLAPEAASYNMRCGSLSGVITVNNTFGG